MPADYASQFNPGFRLDPAKVALVVVDMQYASGSRHEGLGRLLKDQGRDAQGTERFDRIAHHALVVVELLVEEEGVVPMKCGVLGHMKSPGWKC